MEEIVLCQCGRYVELNSDFVECPNCGTVLRNIENSTRPWE